MKQMVMKLPSHGGKRKGAGRKPKNGVKAGVSHAARPQFKARHPVHVTMRVLPGVGFLRGYSRKRAIEHALREVKLRFGMRVVHYSIQGNHLHVIVECDNPSALSRELFVSPNMVKEIATSNAWAASSLLGLQQLGVRSTQIQ